MTCKHWLCRHIKHTKCIKSMKEQCPLFIGDSSEYYKMFQWLCYTTELSEEEIYEIVNEMLNYGILYRE